jgi:hypothetical protein
MCGTWGRAFGRAGNTGQLLVELGSNRNAIYKSLFDAGRKLRTVLAANG